jgi:hypothetical protein
VDAFVARIQDCRWLLVPLAAFSDPPDGRRQGYPLHGRPLESRDADGHPRIGWTRGAAGCRWWILGGGRASGPAPVPADVESLDPGVCSVVRVPADEIRMREHELSGVFLVALPTPGTTDRSARFLLATGDEPGHVRIGRRPYGGEAVALDFEADGAHMRILRRNAQHRQIVISEVSLRMKARLPLNPVDGDLRIEPLVERGARF